MEALAHDAVPASAQPGSTALVDLVQCDRCNRSIARTTCLTFEGADYVYHFCGSACCSLLDAGQRSDRRDESPRDHGSAGLPDVDAARVAFLMTRDGELATRQWVVRTLAIYRRAVLNHGHFASTPEYRRKFILSYLSFRRWLSGDTRRGAIS